MVASMRDQIPYANGSSVAYTVNAPVTKRPSAKPPQWMYIGNAVICLREVDGVVSIRAGLQGDAPTIWLKGFSSKPDALWALATSKDGSLLLG